MTNMTMVPWCDVLPGGVFYLRGKDDRAEAWIKGEEIDGKCTCLRLIDGKVLGPLRANITMEVGFGTSLRDLRTASEGMH